MLFKIFFERSGNKNDTINTPKILPAKTSSKKCCIKYILLIPTASATKNIMVLNHFFLKRIETKKQRANADMVCPLGKLLVYRGITPSTKWMLEWSWINVKGLGVFAKNKCLQIPETSETTPPIIPSANPWAILLIRIKSATKKKNHPSPMKVAPLNSWSKNSLWNSFSHNSKFPFGVICEIQQDIKKQKKH